MPNIFETLLLRLRAIPLSKLEAVALAAGVSKSLPRKLIYGERENPGVNTIQPLLDYFERIDREPKRRAMDRDRRTSKVEGTDRATPTAVADKG